MQPIVLQWSSHLCVLFHCDCTLTAGNTGERTSQERAAGGASPIFWRCKCDITHQICRLQLEHTPAHDFVVYDCNVDNAELIDHSQAVALTYVECFTLRRNDMEEALVESPAVQHVVQKAARKLSLQRALIQELVQRGQGRAPMSFATQSASHGYTTVSKSLTIEQKLDEISGRLRAFERHGRREHERSMADCVQSAVMEVTVTDVAEPPRETPISKQRGASESGSESGGALATGQEVSELKAVVLEMRSTMMSELKAMRELISATSAGT